MVSYLASSVTERQLRQERNRARSELSDARIELAGLRSRDARFRTFPGFYADEVIFQVRAEIAGIERRILWLTGKVVA